MTIIAGFFCLSADAQVPLSLRASLSANLIGNYPSLGQLHTHDTDTLFLVKWDSGAYGEPAWRLTSDGSLITLVGDPLFIVDGKRPDRSQQLLRLAPTTGDFDNHLLAQCRGSFTIVKYSAADRSLQFATDAVGLRSIYYVIYSNVLIFSTTLRVLESIPELRRSLSFQGMAELTAFSFPLADRTPYDGIKILRESQILTATATNLKTHNYYDWAVSEPTCGDPREAANEIYLTFKEAVRIRSNHDTRAYSFLSGGMDSRAIVSTLISIGVDVEALNFSPDGSQDQLYAQLFAEAAGLKCRLHCLKGGSFPNFSLLALAAKTELEQRETTMVDRPKFIWSGDGGSVGLGHVYMDEQMLNIAARNDTVGAVRHFLAFNRIAISTGVMTALARNSLPNMIFEAVVEEVNRYPRTDLGRCIYLFLLFNDQRRHLFKHFESIGQHGLELLTPFYDAKLLKAIAGTPVGWGILHRLYAQFFEHLPRFALETPWQTYPGHVSCPVPSQQKASYQWEKAPRAQHEGFIVRSKLAKELVMAFDETLPPRTFSQNRIWLAAILHAFGLRDCRHILPQLNLYRSHSLNTKNEQS